MTPEQVNDLHTFFQRMAQANLDDAAKHSDPMTKLIANTRATVWKLAAQRLLDYSRAQNDSMTAYLDETVYEEMLANAGAH